MLGSNVLVGVCVNVGAILWFVASVKEKHFETNIAKYPIALLRSISRTEEVTSIGSIVHFRSFRTLAPVQILVWLATHSHQAQPDGAPDSRHTIIASLEYPLGKVDVNVLYFFALDFVPVSKVIEVQTGKCCFWDPHGGTNLQSLEGLHPTMYRVNSNQLYFTLLRSQNYENITSKKCGVFVFSMYCSPASFLGDLWSQESIPSFPASITTILASCVTFLFFHSLVSFQHPSPLHSSSSGLTCARSILPNPIRLLCTVKCCLSIRLVLGWPLIPSPVLIWLINFLPYSPVPPNLIFVIG